MTFFKSSFNSFGETLRTVSLAIGLLVTTVTGVGYIYNLISEQRAMAVEITSVVGRVQVIEQDRKDTNLWRFRIESAERNTEDLNKKMDIVIDTVNQLKTEIAKGR